MGILDWITKKTPDRSPADEPVSPIMYIGGQKVRVISSDAASSVEGALRANPQLYRITNFVASSVQTVPWKCEPIPTPEVKAYEQAYKTEMKQINELLRSPNDYLTPQQLQYWITLSLMLYGRAHFKVAVAPSGLPNAIYPLDALHVKGVLNKSGNVDEYEYGSGPEKELLPTRRVAEQRGRNEAYAAEISFPSLSGRLEYNKMPVAMQSLAKPIAIIDALMQRALDTANGHPNVKYVVTAEKTLTRLQMESLRKHLDNATPGEEDSGNVLFLYNTTVVVHKLDNDLKDIHSKLPLDDMTRQIAGVFGVPIALLGLGSADSAKYASNYNESRLSFWQDTIAPCYLRPIAASMTAAICPSGSRIAFDYDSIPAMWESRAELGATLSRVNFLTTNEKRKILGFEKTDEIPPVLLSSGTGTSAEVETPGAPETSAPEKEPAKDPVTPVKALPKTAELLRIVDMENVG